MVGRDFHSSAGWWRLVRACLMGPLLISLLTAGCGGPPSPASEGLAAKPTKHEIGCFGRWGIMDPGKACAVHEDELFTAWVLLYSMSFEVARTIYEQILDDCPTCTDAHIGLSMAYRYLGSDQDAFRHARIAVGLDSLATVALWNCGELLWPWRGQEYADYPIIFDRLSDSRDLLERAAATDHPGAAHALISLWTYYSATRQPQRARAQLQDMARRGYFPKVVLHQAHNYLVGLDSNAVLLTIGDMDTYPLAYLQEVEKFRTDVSIVNVGMLGMGEYAKGIRDYGQAPITLSDAEIDSRVFGGEILENLLQNAEAQERPIYSTGKIPWIEGAYSLVNEGMVNRLTTESAAQSIDMDRLEYNFDSLYRPVEQLLPPVEWDANLSPITRPLNNFYVYYAQLCTRLAEHLLDREEVNRCAVYCRKAHAILSHFKRDDATMFVLRLWHEALPQDNEPTRLWEARFGSWEAAAASEGI